MSITNEKKQREAFVEQTKKVISDLNDNSAMKIRIQDNKQKHNEEVEKNEDLVKKIANPPSADSSL